MVRQRDIAEKTGLNISTVSRALRGASDIRPATAALVRRTAAQMGYRLQRGGCADTVGLILPEVCSHYYSELAETLRKELLNLGFSMLVSISGFNAEGLLAAYDVMLRQDVCGLIINDFFTHDEQYSKQKHDLVSLSPMPLVLISDKSDSLQTDAVRIDERIAVFSALDHLTELGHTEIGYIGENLSDVRYFAYLSYMKEKGLPVRPGNVKRGRERFELGGYLRAKELITEPSGRSVTAVLACYDQFALGALSAFSELGVSVPQDIAVVGFDNIILNDYLDIQLTSIAAPMEQLCRLAAGMLADNIRNGEDHVLQSVSLQPRLVVRNSTVAGL